MYWITTYQSNIRINSPQTIQPFLQRPDMIATHFVAFVARSEAVIIAAALVVRLAVAVVKPSKPVVTASNSVVTYTFPVVNSTFPVVTRTNAAVSLIFPVVNQTFSIMVHTNAAVTRTFFIMVQSEAVVTRAEAVVRVKVSQNRTKVAKDGVGRVIFAFGGGEKEYNRRSNINGRRVSVPFSLRCAARALTSNLPGRHKWPCPFT